ncbi:YraN family protein [Galactobacter valiniphilus]|uniref:YraN family protein n=1 Tax=Galactobacter valiniphilus TaxID=2676122 RepID=UPI003736B190
MTKAQEVGRAGEEFAAGWLQDRGFTVLERNWRCAKGELDIVALDTGTGEVVAVEVKTRTGSGFGFPAEAVDRAKLRRLHLLVREFAAGPGIPRVGRRVDVLALLWPAHRSAPEAIDHYIGVTP